jgi:WD40 repeat protein
MTQTAARLTGSVHHLCFVRATSGRVLAAARNTGVEVLDPADGSVLQVIAPRQTANTICALPTADGADVILAGGPDGVLHGYDPADGRQVIGHELGAGSVKDLEVYQDGGRWMVAAVLDGGLHVWSPDAGTVRRLADPPEMDPSRLFKVCAYHWADRPWLAAAYTDGYIATWDVRNPDVAPIVQRAHDGPIWSLISTVDHDEEPIVVSGGSDRRMRVWGPKDGAPLQERYQFVADGTIRRLGHVSDRASTMLITASATGAISLWRLDGAPDRPELDVSRHLGEAWALACINTVDGVLVASGDMNGVINIKRLSTALLTEESARVLFRSDTTVWSVAHGRTADGHYLSCAGVDQTVYVIDPSGVRSALALRHHASTVRALAASDDPDHPHLISGGADHRVLDWDPSSGELRGELPIGHAGEVWALELFRHAGECYLASGSADGTVRMVALDRADATVRVLASDCGEVNALAAVPVDDDTLVVVASNKGLRALSVRTGAARSLILPAVSATCNVVNGDRPLLVAARQDGRVQLVDPIAGAIVSTFAVSHGTGQVRALQAVDVAGATFVLGGCDDGRILVWHIDGTLVSNPVRGSTAGIRAMNVVARLVPADGGVAGGGRAGVQSALITAGQDGVVRLWPITMDSPLRSGGTVDRGVRPASILLQDQPTDRDHLARDPLVETLYDALTSSDTKPPVVVGVHAPWGQGKSSLLRQLRTRVDPWSGHSDSNTAGSQPPSHGLFMIDRPGRRGNRPVRTRLTRAWAWSQIQRSGDRDAALGYEMRPVDTNRNAAISVWFNPWMYERTDQIWAGLTREILIAVTERLPQPERERLWFDLNLRRTEPSAMRRRILASYIPRTLSGLVLGALLLFVVAVTVIAMAITAVNSPSIAGLLGPTAILMITVLGTVAQLTSGSFKQIHGWVAPDELNSTATPEHAWKGATDPLTSSDRGYLYMLQHDVGEVVALATTHGPLYIFIDDLDRCGPDIVSDTVEAINLFLNKAFGRCIFVVALDPATVAAHLETEFAGINNRAIDDPMSFGHLRHTGWRFMEKIIDLPIRLPRVPDAALSNYLDRLLDTAVPPPAAAAAAPAGTTAPPTKATVPAAKATVPAGKANAPAAKATVPPTTTPTAGTTAPPGTDAARKRSRAEPAAPAAGTMPSNPATSAGDPVTNVELVIMPDRPSTASSVVAVSELEALPPVRDALRAAVLSLPGRNPRQTKAFVNLWRFYMVLDHRMGLFSPSLLAIERHSIEMARLVELMVRWPYLLDPLGELAADGLADGATNLDRLFDACDDDDARWAVPAKLARLDPDDPAVRGLRDLLRRALPNRGVFTTIARRYL